MSQKTWEVELKFHVDDPGELASRLAVIGFQQVDVQQHEDVYLRHPCRDFAATDEAFRIRRVNDSACLTYKGPRSTSIVKTREELELSIDGSSVEQWKSLMNRLGFQQVVPVRKRRQVFAQRSQAEFSGIHVTIDCVEQLGTFAEIEIVVSEVKDLPEAESRVIGLAQRLELHRRQPQSYLSMLLERIRP